MKDFEYDINTKEQCWYKAICDHSKCGNEFCIRHYKIDALTHMATLEGKQKYPIPLKPDAVDYEAFTKLKNIKSDIKNFVESGKNLLIYSENTGNGKTEWLKKELLAYFDSIWPFTDIECRGLFVSMPKFISAMKANISKENAYFKYVDENIISADLVIFDEINYKDWTPFEQDYMLNVISQRLAIGKSTMYSTNYNLQTIEQKLGTRLSSRIIGQSITIEFKGSDKRNAEGV